MLLIEDEVISTRDINIVNGTNNYEFWWNASVGMKNITFIVEQISRVRDFDPSNEKIVTTLNVKTILPSKPNIWP